MVPIYPNVQTARHATAGGMDDKLVKLYDGAVDAANLKAEFPIASRPTKLDLSGGPLMRGTAGNAINVTLDASGAAGIKGTLLLVTYQDKHG